MTGSHEPWRDQLESGRFFYLHFVASGCCGRTVCTKGVANGTSDISFSKLWHLPRSENNIIKLLDKSRRKHFVIILIDFIFPMFLHKGLFCILILQFVTKCSFKTIQDYYPLRSLRNHSYLFSVSLRDNIIGKIL